LSQYDEVDEFEGNEDNGPKALRDALKKAQNELKALREENATFKAESRKNTVAAVLAAKGMPAKLAGLYTGEPDEASVDAWATEYADVFGIQTAPTPPTEGASPDAQAQYEAMNRAQSAGSAPVEADAALLKQVEAVTNLDELTALINRKG
jgi:hypothetical protein